MAQPPHEQLALLRHDRRVPSDIPLLFAGTATPDVQIVRSAFEAAGWRFRTRNANDDHPDPEETPVAVISGKAGASFDWPTYVETGGNLVMIDPDPEDAAELGLDGFEGTISEASLLFKPDRSGQPLCLQVFGSIRRYRRFQGNALGTFADPYKNLEIPAILHLSRGQGKILVLLFSLEQYISFLHQRNAEIAERTGEASAEKISRRGIDLSCFMRPQLDLLIGVISGFMSRGLFAAGRPMPRFSRAPGGFPSLVAFSFDDISPSWKPLKRSWQQLMHGHNGNGSGPGEPSGFIPGLMAVLRALFDYPGNYREQIALLMELFGRYNATASLYVLPFFANLQNRLRVTGFKGFSKRTFDFLRNSGWDIGTHVCPNSLADYQALRNAFKEHFGIIPSGHRGHELGWVGWIEDWAELDRLGYAYDTTWNWGGHDGLTWTQGTSLPFHPVARDHGMMSILEIPVVAWLEDLIRQPEKSLERIERSFSEYPGIYHFGGHSRLMVDPRYAGFIDQILKLSRRRPDVHLGYNIAELARFWKYREQSDLDEVRWLEDRSGLSFRVASACRDDELAVSVPVNWESGRIRGMRIDGKEREFSIFREAGTEIAACRVPQGGHRVTAVYR